MFTQGYYDMAVHNPYPFHEERPQAIDGRRGGQEVPTHEAWREENLFEDFGEDPNDKSMVVYMEEALKNNFEGFGDQEKASKLFSICSISKDHSRKQLEGENWLSVGEGYPTVDSSPAPTIADRLLAKKS
ncbi:hypothetical protein M9H77_34797 [Catharanthus roseus]|uniref:Uncharacterized protein n=1 Tax=Catharanthus roseus TaxID=4058 RepID=A0ACB9ZPC5_CATRO|nr:hypothetical protein M9H77_34797 [Catharanthus roseus]